jgi:hypothetical protein
VLPSLYLYSPFLFSFWSQPRDSENDNRPEKKGKRPLFPLQGIFKVSILFFILEWISRSFPFFFIYFPSVGFSLRGFVAKLPTTYSTPNLYEKSQKRSMFDSFKKKYSVNKITEARSSVTVLVVTKTVNISQEGTRPICTC